MSRNQREAHSNSDNKPLLYNANGIHIRALTENGKHHIVLEYDPTKVAPEETRLQIDRANDLRATREHATIIADIFQIELEKKGFAQVGLTELPDKKRISLEFKNEGEMVTFPNAIKDIAGSLNQTITMLHIDGVWQEQTRQVSNGIR